ncbi:MAG: hypothetical protein HQK63_16785 [Desulfamplus sp.]|nr:hypothetical protein [Desulfamplus sp.]
MWHKKRSFTHFVFCSESSISIPMCKQRKYQIECIEEMGFKKPFFEKPTDWMIVAKDGYAYVSIPVKK